MHEHFAQRFLGRMCRVTVKVTVLTSSTSASSGLPRSFSSPPQSGHAHCGRCNEVINVFEVLGQLLAADRLAFGGLRGLERRLRARPPPPRP
jgi:hypothetical protein